MAEGEYILPLDADDKIGVDYIKLALIEFERDSKLKVVYCEAEKFGIVTGNWLLQPFSLESLSIQNMIFCSAIYSKSDWTIAGGYDIKLIYGLEDWDFWLGILKNGGKVFKLKYCGFFYRTKQSSMAVDISVFEREFTENHIVRKHVDFFYPNLKNMYDRLVVLQYRVEDLEGKFFNERFLIKKAFKLIIAKYFSFK